MGRGRAALSDHKRASLTAIENARAAPGERGSDNVAVRVHFRTFGLCCVVEDLGIGVLVHPTDKKRVRLIHFGESLGKRARPGKFTT